MYLSVYADVLAPDDSHVAVEEVPSPPGGEGRGDCLYSLLLINGGSTPVFRLDGLPRHVLAGLGGQIARALERAADRALEAARLGKATPAG